MTKCADCGFLASRNFKSRQIEETEQKTRDTGERVARDKFYIFEPPICFMRVANLWSESGDMNNATEDKIYKAITAERGCSEFTRWQQGFTPKEHREMIDREKMLEWQNKRDESDKIWRNQQEHYLVKIAGIYAIIAGIFGAGIGSVITWILTQ